MIKETLKTATMVCMLSTIASAQIKIGDLEISDALAKEYFFDCQKRPDTIFVTRDNMLYGGEGFNSFHDDHGGKYFSWSAVQAAFPLGETKTDVLFAWKFTRARIPSALDFAEWMRSKGR